MKGSDKLYDSAITDKNFHLTEDYRKALDRFINNPVGTFKKEVKPIKTPNVSNSARGGANFRIEEIKRWMQNPKASEKQLRDLSIYLYNANYLYKWFITILAGMPTWDWTLSLDTFGLKKSPDKIEKAYRQGAQYANLKYSKNDLDKAWKTAIIEDWFYGYEVESDDSYFIMKLDPNYCRVASIFEDGIKGFQFNFQYFDDKTDKNGKNIVDTYPEEFRKGYSKYQRTGEQWILLDPLNTVCWKMSDDLDYGIPYFATLFEDLNDIGFYKELAKDKAEIDNFLLLHQHIPVDETSMDKFAISIDLARGFDAMASSVLPEGATMFTSPMEVTAVKTERSNNEKNQVKDAITQAFTGAGLPEQLANSTTAVGIGKAIMANENIVYKFYRQIEKTINFKMRYKFVGNKFKTKIIDMTHFSKSERAAELLTGAQNGLITPTHVASAYGVNPYELLNNIDLENNILGLTHKLQPLLTSHTISSKDTEAHPNAGKAGRPEKKDTEIADSTEVVRDTDANINRAE